MRLWVTDDAVGISALADEATVEDLIEALEAQGYVVAKRAEPLEHPGTYPDVPPLLDSHTQTRKRRDV